MGAVTAGGDRQVLFVGVDACRSRAVAAVPRWSSCLGCQLQLIPVDVPLEANRGVYRCIVDELAGVPQLAGAVITGHKMAMYAAAAERCSYISPDARRLRECTVLASRPDGLAAYATDVCSIGVEVDRIWPTSAAPVVCLGAGGAAAALFLHLLRRPWPPTRIVVCERDPDRAGEFVDLFNATKRVAPGVELQAETGADTWDDVVAAMPPASLVVNATGLGKTDHSSPLTSAAVFPTGAVVWDLNYRGPLPFLALARAQADRTGLEVHDGWRLFVAGWFAALCAVLGVDPPASVEASFMAIAKEVGR